MPITVLANDTDADGVLNPATVTATAPANGTVTVDAAGVVTYTPNLAFIGSDSFTYTVSDDLGAISNVATVNVTVSPIANGVIVISPNGGESFARGAGVTISWSYTGNPGSTVDIELMQNNRRARRIARRIPIGTGGSGSFNWTVPTAQRVGADYSIRVSVSNNAGMADTSNASFSIIPTGTVPPPAGGEAIAIRRAFVNAKTRAAAIRGPQFSFQGTATPGATLNFYLGPDTTGPYIGSAVANARGNWSFRRRVPTIGLPITTGAFSIQTSGGGTLLNQAFAISQ